MKKQHVIITDKQSIINEWIKEGWRVASVTAQLVSSGSGSYSSSVSGGFCFVIEKDAQEG